MGSFYMESTQINYRRDETLKTVDQKLQELSETSAIDTDIAPVFKSTNTYAPGDMVYYRNKLYVFNVEHTGAWAAGDVTATDVTTEVSSLRSGLTNYEATTNAALAVPENTGKNVLPYPFSETTKTVNGVTFTDNGDGTISTSGQATERTIFYIKNANANLHIPAGTYTVSKSYQNAYTVLNVDGYNGNTWVKSLAKSSSTDDVTITVDYDRYDRITMYLEIGANINTDNLIFKPMIRPATITDPTFAPYIPSVDSRIEAVESGLVNMLTDISTNTHLNKDSNLDTLPLGLYGINTYEGSGTGTGIPTYNTVGILWHIKGASNSFIQYIFGYNYFACRNRANTTDAWEAWKFSHNAIPT